MDRTRLGEILRAEGLISDHEAAAALALQAEIGGLMGQLLIRIGALAEADLLRVLSRQLDLPVLHADELPPVERIIAFAAEIRAPPDWWIDREAVAWRPEAQDGAIVCAAAHPLDPALRQRLSQAGFPAPAFRLAPRPVLAALLDGLARGGEPHGPAASSGDAARLRELAQETPVVDFVNGLFSEALSRRASDVHIEPFERSFQVRMRVDGLLVNARTGQRSAFDAVCSRVKLLSGMDIGERRLPQDGRQSVRVAGQELDLRVSTLPSAWGESVVLRLLGKSTRLPQLRELGLGEAQAAQLLALVEKPNGVVLVSGPTGSGKTTTIYRLLTHLNDGARKIVTVEDPVEFDLPGVVQMPVRSDIGLSFATGLRSILRQDPDVIMVGEIRDPETARIAIQAALTGHLVISTVHTNSALAAIARLLDLGVEDYLLADVLRGAAGQRLARRICPHCARPSDPGRVREYERQRPPALPDPADQGGWLEPVGCEHCARTGYLGRLGLFEIVRATAALEHDIRHRAGEDRLLETARRDGFASLFEDGYQKARRGQTTLSEVRRIAGQERDAEVTALASSPA